MNEPYLKARERAARVTQQRITVGIGLGNCKGCGHFFRQQHVLHRYCRESCREKRGHLREKQERALHRQLEDGLGAASCPSCLNRGRSLRLEEEVTSLGNVNLYCRCGYQELVQRRRP